MAKSIMVQGTGSSVGKSVLVTALCRIFKNDGHGVAPFKSQNMALNSYITRDGLEMGRAQVVQAEACGLEPTVEMNPILIKPSSDTRAQVIINGRVARNFDAAAYHGYKRTALPIVKAAYEALAARHEIIVLEGAGSPAEINLRENDIVNMGMAEISNSPVVLVGDIDKGGVFASLAGTLQLLSEDERARVKGVIINKFRGDLKLLEPGLRMLEDIIKIPVLGVVPYFDIHIEDEDSVTERFQKETPDAPIAVDIVKFPYMSNFTDFDSLKWAPGVRVRYVESARDIRRPDMLILPGTKNTIHDLLFLRRMGIDAKIQALAETDCLIVGICGGYQMLGRRIRDPMGIEGEPAEVPGLNFFDMDTVIAARKTTVQVRAPIEGGRGLLAACHGLELTGYEIHMGESRGRLDEIAFLRSGDRIIGVCAGNVLGTYLHGLFDTRELTLHLVNRMRAQKGLAPVSVSPSYGDFKDAEYDRLAGLVRRHLDMEKIYAIVNSGN